MANNTTIKCPKCSATYRVTDAMVARAGKQARCALCKNLFTIVINDDQTPASGKRQDNHTVANAAGHPDPSGETIITAHDIADNHDNNLDGALHSLDEIVDELEKIARHDARAEQPDTAEQDEKVANHGVAIHALTPDSIDSKIELTEEEPFKILEQEAAPPKMHFGIAWWFVAILLMIGLAAQFTWHFRQHRFIYPLISLVADKLDYPPVAMHSPDKFVLNNRLFSRIPGSDNHFQLQLQFTNTAQWPQNYPVIELALTDRHGTTLVRQNLAPEEYLAADPERLINSNGSVETTFIVESSSSDVTGFSLEFR